MRSALLRLHANLSAGLREGPEDKNLLDLLEYYGFLIRAFKPSLEGKLIFVQRAITAYSEFAQERKVPPMHLVGERAESYTRCSRSIDPKRLPAMHKDSRVVASHLHPDICEPCYNIWTATTARRRMAEMRQAERSRRQQKRKEAKLLAKHLDAARALEG